MFPSPQQSRAQSVAPSPTERNQSGYFAGEPWNKSSREVSHQASTLHAMRSPPKFESLGNDYRPTLPSLTLERGGSVPRGPGNWSEQPPGQPYSSPSMYGQQQMSERSPFASRSYFSERPEICETSGMEATKHRKRRGNLPKDTTDKLRAWFVAHLHHPYPTEDEKQGLMRQTKLQMSEFNPLPNT
jgi:Homeobox KN domain